MDTQLRGDPVYDRFQLIVNAPALFNALATAAELGLFTFLAERSSADFGEIRNHTGVPPHQLRVLLQAICATGILERDGDGRYVNSAVAGELLASDAEESWSHILIGWKDVYYPAFAQLTKAMLAGRNTALEAFSGDGGTLYERLSADPEREVVFHRAMSAFTLRSVDGLVGRPEFAGVRHLLDVGGGDGATSCRLVARHPGLRCTIFDLPSVSRLADDKVVRSFPDRVDLQAGDMFADPFPDGVDAVLFSHVLEIFDEASILGLMRKAYDALPSGGRVFIYGYHVSDDETEGIFGARLGLYFNVLASGKGMAYPARDYLAWLVEAGFREVRTVNDLPYEHGLTMGTKE